jgi:L-alanine-DL-glutamate epimerase-like enolase superfamily enzyme
VSDNHYIQGISWYRLPVALKAPFTVASARVDTLENLAVAIRDSSGATGWGEMPILHPITPEQPGLVATVSDAVARMLLGRPVSRVRNLSHALKEALPGYPGLRGAIETALLDLYTRSQGTSVWNLLGAAVPALETDITIPICEQAEAVRTATRWQAAGFRLFKVKVGQDLDADLSRLAALRAGCPGVEWIIDANAGYTLEDALTLLAGLRRLGISRFVFEQPVAAEALCDLARLATEAGVTVLADESVRSVADVWRVIETGHIQAINVKIAKSGVFEALRMARLAQRQGLGLMIGGMVETRLGMGMSAQIAAGLGGFGLHDLDTPLLLQDDPIKGGYRQRGPHIEIDTECQGHGAAVAESWRSDCINIVEA